MARLEVIAQRLPDIEVAYNQDVSLEDALVEYWCAKIPQKKRNELRKQERSWRDVLVLDWIKTQTSQVGITKALCKEPRFTTTLEDVLLTVSGEPKEEVFQVADSKLLAALDYTRAVHSKHARAVMDTVISREQYKELAALEHIIEHLPEHRREQIAIVDSYAMLRNAVVQAVIFSRAEKEIDALQEKVVAYTTSLRKSKSELRVADIRKYRELEQGMPPVEESEHDMVLWAKIQMLTADAFPACKEALEKRYNHNNELFLKKCRESRERITDFESREKLNTAYVATLHAISGEAEEIREFYHAYGEREEMVYGFAVQNKDRANRILATWDFFQQHEARVGELTTKIHLEQKVFADAVKKRNYSMCTTALAQVQSNTKALYTLKDNKYLSARVQESGRQVADFYQEAVVSLERAQECESADIRRIQEKLEEREGLFAAVARPFRRKKLKTYQASYADVTNALSSLREATFI